MPFMFVCLCSKYVYIIRIGCRLKPYGSQFLGKFRKARKFTSIPANCENTLLYYYYYYFSHLFTRRHFTQKISSHCKNKAKTNHVNDARQIIQRRWRTMKKETAGPRSRDVDR